MLPEESIMPSIIDNIEHRLVDSLHTTMEQSSSASIAVGYFNIRGWDHLTKYLEAKNDAQKPFARVLIGMSQDDHARNMTWLKDQANNSESEREIDQIEANKRKKEALKSFLEQLTHGIPTQNDLKKIRNLKKQLEDGLVRVKLFTRRRLHAKTYIFETTDEQLIPRVAFVGSSNLTMSGLGHQFELNVDVVDEDATEKLYKWFEDRWEDNFSLDITDDLIELLDESWITEELLDPYLIYLRVCYLVSRDAREGLAEYSIPASIANDLLEFQAGAVKTLALRLMSNGGAMLGDVVGLGKTITAIAVALMLREEQGYSTLVICPPNLKQMWENYLESYEVFGKVVPYSMATRELPNLRRYQLVVIDESHTLRSDKRQDYEVIQSYIRENESKVLMLTATPYNKRYLDVGNQLSLFIDDDEDLGIAPLKAIAYDSGIAESVDGKINTLAAFKRSDEPEDWRRLMSEHLIRRTRSFIRKNFSDTDPENGREYMTFNDGARFYFPERLAKPLPHSYSDGDPAMLMTDESTLEKISSLQLPRYQLANYLNQEATQLEDEQQIINDLSTGGGNMLGFTRSMFYKRLSSSAYAFICSLDSHVQRNNLYIYALENNLNIPIGKIPAIFYNTDENDDEDVEEIFLSLNDVDPAQQYEQLQKNTKGVRWLRADLFSPELLESLRNDTSILSSLLNDFGPLDHMADSKLNALEKLLKEDHPNEKVVIFSEFKDTVTYITESLQSRGISNVESVSGADANPSSVAHRFSPKSNSSLLRQPLSADEEILILVSTDVLSEGQNLQDAHIVINFDLPWAIIRLIQRAGRVDRVGQESSEVLVYSFLPEDAVENVIELRARIKNRLEEAAIAFGSDEEFFGTEGETQAIEGLYNGTLEDIDDVEIDAASIAFQVWQEAETSYPDLAERAKHLNNLSYSTMHSKSEESVNSVLTYAQTAQGIDAFALINDQENARLVTTSEALQLLKCEPETERVIPLKDHFEKVESAIKGPLARQALPKGKLRGVRLKVWKRLNGSLETNIEGGPEALEAMFATPLQTESEKRLKKALKQLSNDDLAQLVVSLHSDDQLVIKNPDTEDPLSIICSMGFTSHE